MPKQALLNATLEDANDFDGYSELELLKNALESNSWLITEIRTERAGYNYIKIANGDKELTLHVYLKKVNYRNRSEYEKGIQFPADHVTIGYEVEQSETEKTLMLGIYKRDTFDDYLICAWHPLEWGNRGKAFNCFIDVNALAEAFRSGFRNDISKLPRKVFSFRPEFIHYYLTNFNELHKNINDSEIKPAETLEINLTNLKERFAKWLILKNKSKKNYITKLFNSNENKLIETLTKYEEEYKEEFNTPVFSIASSNLSELIDELENNLYFDFGKFFSFSEKQGNHVPRAILGKKNYLFFLRELLIEDKKNNSNSPLVPPINKIYFGSPGTGKSYQITQDLNEIDLIFQKRITFHPESDNASFVGGYKPITDNNGDIKYEFVPQIFINIYVEACNDPNHQYYLIIEEINRGNCAEIFGEIFQLLDRDINYKISPSNELINYLNINISKSKFYMDAKMLLPDNLSILATMNTSDQSLFPMDSAFKRRWEWEYLPINYNKDSKMNPSALYNIKYEDNKTIKWIDFIESVNKIIQDNPSLGMDKCIGNYFVKPDANNEISLDVFIYKVIFYLWNDVFKDEPKDSIFKDKITYQDFFPIKDKGKYLVASMFNELKITESYKIESEKITNIQE
jgi:hypothetical protein